MPQLTAPTGGDKQEYAQNARPGIDLPQIPAAARKSHRDGRGMPGKCQPGDSGAAGDEAGPRGQDTGMQKMSLEALGRELLERAGTAGGGHTADTVVGGHERVLRQTVIAMAEGSVLAEHENPGEATVQVLSGRVRLSAGGESWDGRAGDLLIVPDARHSLQALEAAAVLLTVVKLP
jgi:quercetin dioxygenase-like cupin family protein